MKTCDSALPKNPKIKCRRKPHTSGQHRGKVGKRVQTWSAKEVSKA